jgi:DNA anti-recombination protein RmuC
MKKDKEEVKSEGGGLSKETIKYLEEGIKSKKLEEHVYEEVVKILEKIYTLKKKDEKYINEFNESYKNMFESENNLFNYLNESAKNIGKLDHDAYIKLNMELNQYMKIYDKSLKVVLSTFKKIVKIRIMIKKDIEKALELMKELEKIRGP